LELILTTDEFEGVSLRIGLNGNLSNLKANFSSFYFVTHRLLWNCCGYDTVGCSSGRAFGL